MAPMYSSQTGAWTPAPAADRAQRSGCTVLDLFHRYIRPLSQLPGEVSQFEETGVGYEWRCQLDLGQFASGQAMQGVPCSVQLHFSLVDLDSGSKPLAVLYLVEQAQPSGWQERTLLSLDNPQSLHDRLSASLLPLNPTLASLEKAAAFIGALVVVTAALGVEVDWV